MYCGFAFSWLCEPYGMIWMISLPYIYSTPAGRLVSLPLCASQAYVLQKAFYFRCLTDFRCPLPPVVRVDRYYFRQSLGVGLIELVLFCATAHECFDKNRIEWISKKDISILIPKPQPIIDSRIGQTDRKLMPINTKRSASHNINFRRFKLADQTAGNKINLLTFGSRDDF